jgi:TRAP transporter 4TM/12TM fusion protein
MNEKSATAAITPFALFATAISLYQIAIVGSLAAMAGIFVPQHIHRAISLAAALSVIFMMLPLFGKRSGHGVAGKNNDAGPGIIKRIPDFILLACALVGLGYVIVFDEEVIQYSEMGYLDLKGMIFAAMICIPLVEAVRRTAGPILMFLVLTLVVLTVFQNYLPGILYGRGYTIDRLLYSAFVGEAGIFGLPLGVASNIILIFLLFGAMMDVGGAGGWFLRVALVLTGSARGGPAKAAVIGSAFFGSISGSPSANVATTGVITIPLMKQAGYRPAIAGGVEAVASTGGQILPPVMGAIAFVMADWIGKSYAEIALAALVPALLYYLIVFVSVHLQAHRDNIVPVASADQPPLWSVFKEGWYNIVPLVALIWFLIIDAYPPGMAGVLTIPFVIGVSFLSKDKSKWLLPDNLMRACAAAVRNWITIVAITAFVGIMIGALELSGVGIKISTFILDLSGKNLILTMIFVGMACFILGMGLDAIPVYVTLATLMAPALIQLGVPDVAAHLFVVYWGLASFITPPLCLAVFVAISLSGSRLWETGWEAVKLGIAVFIVPFAFVLNPGLLLIGPPATIALAIVTATAGAILLACGIQGWGLTRLAVVSRILAVAGGLLLIGPGVWTAVAGITLGLVAVLPPYLMRSEKLSPSAP